MNKEFICGKAFEDLTNEEMMEFEGGATVTTTLSTTTLSCIGASIVISAGVSLVVSLFSD